jgi:spore coat polysaccharide biosynthesis protein SpsF
MGTTIGIIQARMGSERLPGKILAPLGGRPLLDRLVSRIERARVAQWWLATSEHPSDDVTAAWGFELGLRVFRGAERDVLSRFLAIAAETGAEWLVRVTADNPFLDARLIDHLLDARDAKSEAAGGADLVRHRGGIQLPAATNATVAAEPVSPHLPIGYGVELARRAALETAAQAIPSDAFHHRVHVTSWLASQGRVLEVPTPADWPDRGRWRWTVDTDADLAMARSAFRLFGYEATSIDYPTMVARLDAQPEIPALNAHVRQKALEAG